MIAQTASTPGSSCNQCGAAVTPEALSCTSCHQLIHAVELERLASEAKAAARSGDVMGASAAWRKTLSLLPAESLQHKSVNARIAELEKPIAPPVPSSASEQPTGVWAKRLGALGPIGLMLWKFKLAALFAITKAKFLLLGLTKLSTLGSMLAFLGVYWTIWGWKFALGFVLCIYIHEMGHVAELRRFGIAASAPMFIPGLGAFISLKQLPANVMQDSRVGLAGPLWGLGAAALCLFLGAASGLKILTAIGVSAAWMNLFNLIPVWQLDGGRGFRALTRGHRWIALGAVIVLWAVTKQGLLCLLALGAGYRLFLEKDFARTADYVALGQFLGLIAALSLMCVK
jgi:Zn-dependent protease